MKTENQTLFEQMNAEQKKSYVDYLQTKQTENNGHDACRHNTKIISLLHGYNTDDKIKDIKKHVLIKNMLKNKDIKVYKIGIMYMLACRKNITACKYVKIQTDFELSKLIMNIIRPICNVSGHDRFCKFNVNDVIIKRMFTDKTIYKQFCKVFDNVILLSDDIIPFEVFKQNTNNEYQKTLTNKEKKQKYNN